jgi:hypothetical protein
MSIDFQGLLAVMTATENEPNILMAEWECGTSHCMIGAFCDQNHLDVLQLRAETPIMWARRYPCLITNPELSIMEAIAVRFGITEHEARWLFAGIFKPFASNWRPVMNFNKEKALKRLRKFIYYKLHKQEMLIETGRNQQIIDTGRNIAGRQSAVLASSI